MSSTTIKTSALTPNLDDRLTMNEDELEDEEEDLEEPDDPGDLDYNSNVASNSTKESTNASKRSKSSQTERTSTKNNSSAKLLSQLIGLNLKLFQDNFRLKKFCSNFKLYLEKYRENSPAVNTAPTSRSQEGGKSSKQSSSSTTKGASSGAEVANEIYTKYEQNYGNIQWQLFNDYAAIKGVIGEFAI